MKKFSAFLSIIATGSLLCGQTVVLTRDSHGLTPNKVNLMQRASFVDPGPGGSQRVWDLSAMEAQKSFRGDVLAAAAEDPEGSFPMSDVVLNEEGSRFFFSNEGNELKAWGTMSRSGRVLMQYDTPFTKMVYPFKYGDSFSGSFEGSYFSGERKLPLVGTYSVEADAYGKLILPGGVEIENSLRVVSRRSYDVAMGETPQTWEIVTYRWYDASDRFPLAVLITRLNSACGNGNTTYYAAYKLPSSPGEQAKAASIPTGRVSVFPNPVDKEFSIEYLVPGEGHVVMDLYDNNGKHIARLSDQYRKAGQYTEVFSRNELGLEPGMYYVRSNISGKNITTTFISQR